MEGLDPRGANKRLDDSPAGPVAYHSAQDREINGGGLSYE
jgi:hypothetical protein